jgi:hypothetical protein
MSYREGVEKFYDLFGAKDGAPFYIDLAHVPELRPKAAGSPRRDRWTEIGGLYARATT